MLIFLIFGIFDLVVIDVLIFSDDVLHIHLLISTLDKVVWVRLGHLFVVSEDFQIFVLDLHAIMIVGVQEARTTSDGFFLGRIFGRIFEAISDA